MTESLVTQNFTRLTLISNWPDGECGNLYAYASHMTSDTAHMATRMEITMAGALAPAVSFSSSTSFRLADTLDDTALDCCLASGFRAGRAGGPGSLWLGVGRYLGIGATKVE